MTKKEVMVGYIWVMFCFVILFFDSCCLFFCFLCLCIMVWCNDDGLVNFLQSIRMGWLFFGFDCFFISDMVKNGYDMEKLQIIFNFLQWYWYDMAKNRHGIDKLQMQRCKMIKHEIL